MCKTYKYILVILTKLHIKYKIVSLEKFKVRATLTFEDVRAEFYTTAFENFIHGEVSKWS